MFTKTETWRHDLIENNTSFLSKEAIYFNAHSIAHRKQEYIQFKKQLLRLKKEIDMQNQSLVFLCIGSDRATGDCFGPLVGEELCLAAKKKNPLSSAPIVYGTLEKPVHAINLEKRILDIYRSHANPFIIAVDASLGIKEHIGFITFGQGPLFPGIGVKKHLPEIGDAAITGIVNISTEKAHHILQTTRLAIVYKLATFVSQAIIETLL